MAGIVRYRLSIAVVLAALGATVAVFVFARPQYRDPNAGPTVDLTKVTHHSVVDVQHAFALQGLLLRYRTSFANVTMISNRPAPWPTDALYVYVGGRTGTIGWGARDKHAYEAQFDNLLVQDGRTDPRGLEAVKAAVAALR